jgi:hypothetical protein
MKRFALALVVAVTAMLTVAPIVEAHHSVATFFFLDKTVMLKGTVQEFRLVNPHMLLKLEVTTASGEKEIWTLTGGVTGDLRAAGWTPDAIKFGDVVTVEGAPARNPDAKGMYVRKLTTPEGKVLTQRIRD